MRMRTLNHVNLVVRDVEASAAFYEELFGMERQWKEGDFVFLHCGGADLALVGGAPKVHPKFHIGFRVDTRAEVDAWLEHLGRRGAPITHGPADYDGYYTFTCRDPDGHGVEVYFETAPRGRAGFPPGEGRSD